MKVIFCFGGRLRRGLFGVTFTCFVCSDSSDVFWRHVSCSEIAFLGAPSPFGAYIPLYSSKVSDAAVRWAPAPSWRLDDGMCQRSSEEMLPFTVELFRLGMRTTCSLAAGSGEGSRLDVSRRQDSRQGSWSWCLHRSCMVYFL